jgi:hypothetical protein
MASAERKTVKLTKLQSEAHDFADWWGNIAGRPADHKPLSKRLKKIHNDIRKADHAFWYNEETESAILSEVM